MGACPMIPLVTSTFFDRRPCLVYAKSLTSALELISNFLKSLHDIIKIGIYKALKKKQISVILALPKNYLCSWKI